MEPTLSRVKIKAWEDFEDGFDDWVANGWVQLRYDSDIAKGMNVSSPPQAQSNKNTDNQVRVYLKKKSFRENVLGWSNS